MPDEATPGKPSQPPAEPIESSPQLSFNIGEEYGTAAKSLPPMTYVVAALAVVAAIAVIFAVAKRPRLVASGSIDDIETAELPGQNVLMVAINVTIANHGLEPFKIQSLQADVDAGGEHASDDAAPVVDIERYLQAFPTLKLHALAPLSREIQIAPGASTSGTMIVSFPLTEQAFLARKAFTVTVQAYHQALPLVLSH
jgi:hypothetical protein